MKTLLLNIVLVVTAIAFYEMAFQRVSAQAPEGGGAAKKTTKLELYDRAGSLSIVLDGEARRIVMYPKKEGATKAIHIGLLKDDFWGYWAGSPADKSEVSMGANDHSRGLVLTDEKGVGRLLLSDVNDVGTSLAFVDNEKVRLHMTARRNETVGLEFYRLDGKTRTVYLANEDGSGGVSALWDEKGKMTSKLPAKDK